MSKQTKIHGKIRNVCASSLLHCYIYSYYGGISQIHLRYTVLNLSKKLPQWNPKWYQEAIAEKISRWKQKILHGRYPAEIETEGIDQMVSVMWLRRGAWFPETLLLTDNQNLVPAPTKLLALEVAQPWWTYICYI